MIAARSSVYNHLRATTEGQSQSLFATLGLINNADINGYLRDNRKVIVAEEHQGQGDVIYRYSTWKVLGEGSLADFLFEPELEFEAKCLHEVIPGECLQKMRFDIDIDDTKIAEEQERHQAAGVIVKTILTSLPGIIQPYCPSFDPKFAVCASHGPHKVSYHVILTNYYFDNARVCKEIFKAVSKACLEVCQPYLDSSIYKSTSNLRLLHCHKLEDRRIKRLVMEETFDGHHYVFDQSKIVMPPVVQFGQSLVATLITNIVGCEYVNFPVQETVQVVVEVKDELVLEASERLQMMFPDMEFRVEVDKNGWKRVFYRPDAACLLCKRIHEKEGHNYLVFYRNGGVALRCGRDEIEKRSVIIMEGQRQRRQRGGGLSSSSASGSSGQQQDRLPYFDPAEEYYWPNFYEWFKQQTFTGDEKGKMSPVDENTILLQLSRVCRIIPQGDGIYGLFKESKDKPFSYYKILKQHKPLMCLLQWVDENGNDDQREISVNEFLVFKNKAITSHTMQYIPYHIDAKPELDYRQMSTFSGFKAHRVCDDLTPEKLAMIKPILNHVFVVVADKNVEYFKWIMTWIAYPIRFLKKAGKVLAIIGDQGCGKTTVFDFLKACVYGEHLFQKYDDLRELDSAFNGELLKPMVVNIEETCDQTGKVPAHIWTRIKGYITGDDISIRMMRTDRFSIKNIISWSLTSNHKHGIMIEPTDRRYAIFQASNAYLGDFSYFDS